MSKHNHDLEQKAREEAEAKAKADAEQKARDEAAATAVQPKTVRMKRYPAPEPHLPTTADVAAEEVTNWISAGWELAA